MSESGRPEAGSVAWAVNGERLAVCGWSAAILMQVAHPLVAAGVAAHSGFRTSAMAPVARLHHTIRAMLALTFGTDDEARAVVARIRGVHDRVNGRLSEPARAHAAGTAYSAHDPRLLTWVHVTLLDAVLRAHDLFVRPLTAEERDRYCAESRVAAAWLGVPADNLPATADALRAQIDARLASGEIDVTREAASLAQAILHPAIGRWIWPVGAAHRLITVGLLPPALRTAYGLPWTPRDERRLQRLARIIRALRRVSPSAIARWRAARLADRRALSLRPQPLPPHEQPPPPSHTRTSTAAVDHPA